MYIRRLILRNREWHECAAVRDDVFNLAFVKSRRCGATFLAAAENGLLRSGLPAVSGGGTR